MGIIPQCIPEGYCIRCQGCCRFDRQETIWAPKLLEEEKARLGSIRIVADSDTKHFLCAFLSARTNKCMVYRLRPFECQLYPFLFHRARGKVFIAIDPNCAYVAQNLKRAEFKDHIQRIIALIQTVSFRNVLKNNPQLIQEYDGVKDLAELE